MNNNHQIQPSPSNELGVNAQPMNNPRHLRDDYKIVQDPDFDLVNLIDGTSIEQTELPLESLRVNAINELYKAIVELTREDEGIEKGKEKRILDRVKANSSFIKKIIERSPNIRQYLERTSKVPLKFYKYLHPINIFPKRSLINRFVIRREIGNFFIPIRLDKHINMTENDIFKVVYVDEWNYYDNNWMRGANNRGELIDSQEFLKKWENSAAVKGDLYKYSIQFADLTPEDIFRSFMSRLIPKEG